MVEMIVCCFLTKRLDLHETDMTQIVTSMLHCLNKIQLCDYTRLVQVLFTYKTSMERPTDYMRPVCRPVRISQDKPGDLC